MFLEIGQLVPGDLGNFRKVSVLSRCFRIWSAGSGRFRKFSEGFRVFTLFFKLVSWFRKISENFGRFPCYPVVFPSWSAVFRLLKVDFNVIPLFSSWSTVFRLISMISHCFSSWSTVFGCFSWYPIVFHGGQRVRLFSLCVPIVFQVGSGRNRHSIMCEAAETAAAEVQVVFRGSVSKLQKRGVWGEGNMSCWRARSVKMT